MKLTQLLLAIEGIALNNGLSQPYIVGGLARDKYLNKLDDIHDVDLTTGDDSVFKLADLVAASLQKKSGIEHKKMNDGHSRLIVDGFKIDFSSNFLIPGIDNILPKLGLSNATPMQKELYSRDFTCNAILLTMDLKEILDPIGVATKSLDSKIVKTCLTPELTLGYDHKRIPRAFYIASKLNFKLENNVKLWIKNNPNAIKDIKPDYFAKKINKAFNYDLKGTADLLREVNLLDFVKSLPNMM